MEGRNNIINNLGYAYHNQKRGIIPHKQLIINPYEKVLESYLENPPDDGGMMNKEERNYNDEIFTMRTPRRATVPKQVNRIMGIRLGK